MLCVHMHAYLVLSGSVACRAAVDKLDIMGAAVRRVIRNSQDVDEHKKMLCVRDQHYIGAYKVYA